MDEPIVTLLLVTRDCVDNVDYSLKSYLEQTYDLSKIELIFIDGMSTDGTKDKLMEFREEFLSTFFDISLLENEKKILAAGWNIGINRAKGEYVCRIDAHSRIPPDYIKKCVSHLGDHDHRSVGGVGGVLNNI